MNHIEHIKNKNYCSNVKTCKQCSIKNKRRCRKLSKCKFHDNYFVNDCEKYSISLELINDDYQIRNTGTKLLRNRYFVCSKNFKTEGCLFLIPDDILQLHDLNLNTYIVAFAQVDKKNWVRSNSFLIKPKLDPIPNFEQGVTLYGYNTNSAFSIGGRNVLTTVNIVNVGDVDGYDITYEMTYDPELFEFTPGIINTFFTITPDGKIIGYVPFAPKETTFVLSTINRVGLIWSAAMYPIRPVIYFDFLFSSPTSNIINHYQSRSRTIF